MFGDVSYLSVYFYYRENSHTYRIDIDADFEIHAIISESGIYQSRFRRRAIASINRVSESLWTSSLITSSKVCPGFLSS